MIWAGLVDVVMIINVGILMPRNTEKWHKNLLWIHNY